MPLVYRSMFGENGVPRIGRSATALGVRIPTDIAPDANDRVAPGTGGMSVAPSWRSLPSHRIPRRLREFAPDATGNDKMFCWRYGNGEFASSSFAEDLNLSVSSQRHGNIEPACEMATARFEALLGATQTRWVNDET